MGKRRKARKAKGASVPRGAIQSRAYEAALSVPSRRHVIGAELSQDAAMERAMGRLRNWGRYLDENSAIAIALLDEWVAGTVGSGIVTIPKPLRPDGSVDEALGVQLIRRWRQWIRKADVTGELHWHEAQRLIARAWPRDGEHLIQHVAGRNRGYPFTNGDTPYRVELLESEMCPRDFNQDQGNWRQGISHDDWNRPLAYVIYKRHPGDTGMIGSSMVSFDDLKSAPRENITHLKNVKRWPSTRGVSQLHGVIATLYDVKDLEDSERQKNRILASWSAAIQRGPDYVGADDTDETGDRYIRTEGGTVIDSLRVGEQIVGVGPDYPSADMPDHIADQIRRVCRGFGVKSSSVSGRYDQGSYSAQRGELVESVGASEIRQDKFVEVIVRRVYEQWAMLEFMFGEVALPPNMRIEDAFHAEYRGPVVPWIDPLKEIEADALAVEKGFAGIDQIRIKRGAPEEMIGQPAPRPEPAPAPAAAPPRGPRAVEDDEEEAA